MVKIKYIVMVALLTMLMTTAVSAAPEFWQEERECVDTELGASGLIWTGRYYVGIDQCIADGIQTWFCQDNVLWSEYEECDCGSSGCVEEIEEVVVRGSGGDSRCSGYEFKDMYKFLEQRFRAGESIPYRAGYFKWACYEDSF